MREVQIALNVANKGREWEISRDECSGLHYSLVLGNKYHVEKRLSTLNSLFADASSCLSSGRNTTSCHSTQIPRTQRTRLSLLLFNRV